MMKRSMLVVVLALFIGAIAIGSTDEARLAPTQTKRTWTKMDSKAYAHDQLNKFAHQQYKCLNALWMKESKWNPRAFNKVKVMGRNAGGIPQLLGLDPSSAPTKQIERGLDYIYFRYSTPCKAWSHWQKHRWY